jgi:ATP-dependent DNA helicase RecQ
VRGAKRRRALERIEAGGSLLVLTTPETFLGEELSAALQNSGIALAAIDEAHCISEWGHDFRPAYRRIGTQLKRLGAPPLLALTATATQKVRDGIARSLAMRRPRRIEVPPHRSNLAFDIVRCGGDERLRAVVRLALRLRRPGLVYAATRKEVDEIYTIVSRFGLPALRYHAGMRAAERNEAQQRFMQRRARRIMVATNAFGLGVDKPDIRFVLHAQAPASLEQYVQEAGRAGRDGRRAHCILLYDPEDRLIHSALQARSRIRPDQLARLGEALLAWWKEGRAPVPEALAVSAEVGIRVAQALLAQLEEAGLVISENHELRPGTDGGAFATGLRELTIQFDRLRLEDGHRLDAVDAYASDDGCRARFLQRYFGEQDAEDCGICDRCRGAPPRPAHFFEPLSPPQPTGSRRSGSRARSRGRAAKPRRRARRRR